MLLGELIPHQQTLARSQNLCKADQTVCFNTIQGGQRITAATRVAMTVKSVEVWRPKQADSTRFLSFFIDTDVSRLLKTSSHWSESQNQWVGMRFLDT